MTTTLTLWTHLFSMITILTTTTIPLQLHGHLQWSTLIMLIPISHPARLVTHHSTIGYTTLCTVLGSQISSGHAFPCNTTFILRLGGVTCPYTTTQNFQNTWSTVSPWVIPGSHAGLQPYESFICIVLPLTCQSLHRNGVPCPCPLWSLPLSSIRTFVSN